MTTVVSRVRQSRGQRASAQLLERPGRSQQAEGSRRWSSRGSTAMRSPSACASPPRPSTSTGAIQTASASARGASATWPMPRLRAPDAGERRGGARAGVVPRVRAASAQALERPQNVGGDPRMDAAHRRAAEPLRLVADARACRRPRSGALPGRARQVAQCQQRGETLWLSARRRRGGRRCSRARATLSNGARAPCQRQAGGRLPAASTDALDFSRVADGQVHLLRMRTRLRRRGRLAGDRRAPLGARARLQAHHPQRLRRAAGGPAQGRAVGPVGAEGCSLRRSAG
jgi:hypothetical protein